MRDLFLAITITTLLLGVTLAVRADELERPVTAGSINARMYVDPVEGDEQLTLSVSLEGETSRKRILCLPATNDVIVEGPTLLVTQEDAQELFRAFAWTGPDCTLEASDASFDAYRIVFVGKPARPRLVRLEGEG